MNEWVLYCLRTFLVRLYYYPYHTNDVKWHVAGYSAIKWRRQDLKLSSVGPSSVRCQSLPTDQGTSHCTVVGQQRELLPTPSQRASSSSYGSEPPGHFLCTSYWVLSIPSSSHWKEGKLPLIKHLSCSKHHVVLSGVVPYSCFVMIYWVDIFVLSPISWIKKIRVQSSVGISKTFPVRIIWGEEA